jgi:hypothetical protein
MGLFDPALAATGKVLKRPVSQAGTAGDCTGPAAGGSAFQLLLDSPSDPADGLPETLPAKGRSTPGPAVVPPPERRGSSAREPVLAAASQSSRSPAVPSGSAAAPSSPRPAPAGFRLAARAAEPVAPLRTPVVNAEPVVPRRTPVASAAPVAPRRTPVVSAEPVAPQRTPVASAEPLVPLRTSVVSLRAEGAGNSAASGPVFSSPSVFSPESAVKPSSPRQEPACSRLAAEDAQTVAPRRTPVVNLGTEGAGDSAVSSGPALLPGSAVLPEAKNHGLTAWAGAAGEAGYFSPRVASVAGTPGRTVQQTPRNRTSVKPAAAPYNSGPKKTARSAEPTAGRDAPQHSSVQAAPAAGETPALTPRPVIPPPARAMDLGAAASAGTPNQAPAPGAARSNSAPTPQPVDRPSAGDRATTAPALRTDIPSAPSSPGIPVASPPAEAPAPPPTRAEASEWAPPPSHTAPESRLTAGADRSSLMEPQHESALRTESSGKSARPAGLEPSPVSGAATRAPVAFQVRLTAPESTSLAGSAVAVGARAPEPCRSGVAPHQEPGPPAAGAAVSGEPARPDSASGRMSAAGADRDPSIGDAPRANRPETASTSRGASRSEPAETAAPPAEPLTAEAGDVLSAMLPARPPLCPAVQAIAEDSPAPPRPPAEHSAPAAPAATPVNREIQLQVGSGTGGVAVRVTERAGEVRLDVRTGDSQLTSALRQELPTLATRLAQSGFHAAIWHPASASTLSPNPTEKSAPANGDGQGGQRHGRQQQQRPPDERPRQASRPPQTNMNRKDFQWLFTSLQ